MDQKKLRVVFLSRYIKEVNRGAETYVLELSKRLADKYEVEVLSGKDSDSFQKMISGNFDVIIATNGRISPLEVFTAHAHD